MSINQFPSHSNPRGIREAERMSEAQTVVAEFLMSGCRSFLIKYRIQQKCGGCKRYVVSCYLDTIDYYGIVDAPVRESLGLCVAGSIFRFF